MANEANNWDLIIIWSKIGKNNKYWFKVYPKMIILQFYNFFWTS